MGAKFVIWLIGIYQKTLSPDHGLLRYFFVHGACRYHPTCSNYTKQAIERYGLRKGFLLGLSRVSRCHPWGKSGYDPVK
ncbi:membrane protein insertion efficiency factor YidD [Candidatus Berkelbacteria bacterium]|nr:membrane protein insertion efficiency factor YidD [Candidatus Berkelbacteria bacterium]